MRPQKDSTLVPPDAVPHSVQPLRLRNCPFHHFALQSLAAVESVTGRSSPCGAPITFLLDVSSPVGARRNRAPRRTPSGPVITAFFVPSMSAAPRRYNASGYHPRAPESLLLTSGTMRLGKLFERHRSTRHRRN